MKCTLFFTIDKVKLNARHKLLVKLTPGLAKLCFSLTNFLCFREQIFAHELHRAHVFSPDVAHGPQSYHHLDSGKGSSINDVTDKY